MTFEITGSTTTERMILSEMLVDHTWECLDKDTWNLTVPDELADFVTDWGDDYGIKNRMI